MSHHLHVGFDLAEPDIVSTFLRRAPDMLYLDPFAALFTAALGAEGVTAHLCCLRNQDGVLLPLIGDDPTLADPAATGDRHILTFDNETPDGVSLHLRLALPARPGPDRARPDRARLSRLRTLASLHTALLLPLLEAHDDATPLDRPTDTERQCHALAQAGRSNIDIGERLGLSAPAVRIHLRRIAARRDKLANLV